MEPCQIAECDRPSAGTVSERLHWREGVVVLRVRVCHEHIIQGWGADWKPEYVYLQPDQPGAGAIPPPEPVHRNDPAVASGVYGGQND